MALVRVQTIAELRQHLDRSRSAGWRVGLVPTMGALHDGHASLIRVAVAENEVVVTTIFVNPLQFAPTEDLAAYPRDLAADSALAEAAGARYLFTPSVEEMYPFGPRNVLTNVSVSSLSAMLDGAARPGHFDGVATVVAKLLAIAGTCRAYFGEKDFQQLAIVRRMAADLSFPVEIIGCPTQREPHGLAMSSRNRYLTANERERAVVIHQALQAGVSLVTSGESSVEPITAAMQSVLATEPGLTLDYAALVDPLTLEVPVDVAGTVRLLIAGRLGKARLIDNIGATSPHARTS
jgi:pantoate--beta-alanine ligase